MFEDQATAVACRDELCAMGVDAHRVADHPLDWFGRGDIYLVFAPEQVTRERDRREPRPLTSNDRAVRSPPTDRSNGFSGLIEHDVRESTSLSLQASTAVPLQLPSPGGMLARPRVCSRARLRTTKVFHVPA